MKIDIKQGSRKVALMRVSPVTVEVDRLVTLYAWYHGFKPRQCNIDNVSPN